MTNFEILQSSYNANLITKQDIYDQVVNGKITPYEYQQITNEDMIDIPLEIVKQIKINELDLACTADIENGFLSTAGDVLSEPVLWGMDLKNDQPNLNQKASDIAMGLAGDTITWKPKGESIPVTLTIEQFKALWNDGKHTKEAKIAKFWTLKAQVLVCTTEEEVNTLVW